MKRKKIVKTIKYCLVFGAFFLPMVSEGISCKDIPLKTLDKVTGRTGNLSMTIGEPKQFGTLTIHVKACDRSNDTEIPEMTVFLEIYEAKDNQDQQLFSSWMFGSSPSVSSLEHPIYDVWVDLPQTA